LKRKKKDMKKVHEYRATHPLKAVDGIRTIQKFLDYSNVKVNIGYTRISSTTRGEYASSIDRM